MNTVPSLPHRPPSLRAALGFATRHAVHDASISRASRTVALAGMLLRSLTTLTTLALPLQAQDPRPAPSLPSQPAAPLSPPVPLTLGEAARLAARQSAATLVANARADQADARFMQRRGDLLPFLNATASEGERNFNSASFGVAFPGLPPGGTVLGPVRNYDVRGNLRIPLLDLAAWSKMRSAQTSVTAARADAANQADLAATTGAVAYLRALRAEGFLRARSADSVLADELVSIAREQVKSGVGIGLDLTRAQSQAAAARAQLIAARAERDRSRLDLYRALGLSLDARVDFRDSLGLRDDTPVPFYQDAVANAFRARPDLAAAVALIAAQQQQVSGLKAERLPTVGLIADQGVNGANTDRMLNTYSWGIGVTIPIFDGFKRDGRQAEQEAQLRELEIREKDLRQQVTVEVRGALLDVVSAREQADASQVRLQLAEQELSEARDRFRAGVAGNADVVTASLSLNSARTQLVDALTQYAGARVQLARVQGAIAKLP